MATQRKLVKGKKHRKITKRKQSKPNKKHTGGAEPSKKDDNEIDLANDLFNDNLLDEENKSAKTGAYNKNDSNGELSGIAKELQETQGGLSFQYPGPLNISQEQALKDKLNNVREEGFPGLEMKATEQFKPKINYKKIYETDLLSSTLIIPTSEFDNTSNNNKTTEQLEVEEMN
jgi:hypothetical protein